MFQNDSSYIQIYRDLLLNPSFVGLPPSYRCVLFSLLANACFAPWQQDDHGVLIDLLPGQFMCTIRYLADLANVGKNDAERALKKFVEMKIVRLEVRHKKTIVTILYGIKFKSDETTKETRKRQDRDTKEETLVSSNEETPVSPNQEIKKTTTTTRKSPLSFSGKISKEEKANAKKAFDLFESRKTKLPDEDWNIDLLTLEKHFHIFGDNYVSDQINYLIKRMDKYRRSKDKLGNKVSKVDDPKAYFEMACSQNWAKSLNTKE